MCGTRRSRARQGTSTFSAAWTTRYPRETVVAEKFQAMVYLRTLNSRMKDFYDVWLLASQFAFDGAVLAKAIAATFENRETPIEVAPIAFTSDFTEQASTLAQWTAFRNRLPNTECPAKLSSRKQRPSHQREAL
jgi:hypothetical protein